MKKVKSPKIEPKGSKCCREPMIVLGDTEGTRWYVCSKCQRNCDPYIAPKKLVKKETEFYSKSVASYAKELDNLPFSKARLGESKKQILDGQCGHTPVSQWQTHLRNTPLIIIGILLTLAFFKLSYDIHTSGLGDILLIRR